MPLSPGARLGSYEVTGALGAGGMGEVYRARDSKLNRDVALKVLPEAFTTDADRLARFKREAQVLASLNHPNIAAVYGFEDSGSTHALVMELVEGPTLAELIELGGVARRGLTIGDALPLARQIADAIESAHENGIIHRDLKPANIKVRPDGTIKILDFGLAKAMTPDATTADAMNSPTLTNRATQMGMILGTAAYMAPEQAKGKPVDKRADIWAFGVVLYEMLTGRRAFEGEDVSTTLAAVLMKDPEWAALPASTPTALRRLIHRCVERDPKLRLRDIGEARVILNDVDGLRDQPAQPIAASHRGTRPVVPWLLAGLGISVAAITLAVGSFRAPPPAQPVRFTIPHPPGVRPISNGSDYHGGVISPDGLRLAFNGADGKTGQIAIYVRRIDAIEATMVKGTEGGRYPFWAPTSQTIAFYAKGKLNRVDIDGTSPLVICDAPTGGWGGSWNADDIIVTGINDPGPLVKVSAKGGDTPAPVTKMEAGESDHDWPHFLPDGRHFLYTAWGSSTSTRADFYVGSLDSLDRTLVQSDAGQIHPAAYANPGFMLFIRGGTLIAQRLDTSEMKLQGDPMPIAPNAAGPITASTDGSISYITLQATVWNQLVWTNPDGTGGRVVAEPGFYADPSISPSGTEIAYAKKESATGTWDIYIRSLATGGERRLTFDAANDRAPVWSPTGDEIVFSASREPAGLYRKKASGAGEEKLISGKDVPQSWPYQWHPDGFITTHTDRGSSYDTFRLSLADFKTTPLVNTPKTNEERASVSPDGHWLSYDARETSRFEVFLTTNPPSVSKLPVTTEGGAEAKWSKDGKALYYVSAATGALMVATVTPGDPPTFSAHRQVNPGPLDWGWNSNHSFDIDHGSGRFIIAELVATNDLTVLTNWQALIRK
jgi:serine/threonine protein kinase/Tol biopolymer transport system component